MSSKNGIGGGLTPRSVVLSVSPHPPPSFGPEANKLIAKGICMFSPQLFLALLCDHVMLLMNYVFVEKWVESGSNK